MLYLLNAIEHGARACSARASHFLQALRNSPAQAQASGVDCKGN